MLVDLDRDLGKMRLEQRQIPAYLDRNWGQAVFSRYKLLRVTCRIHIRAAMVSTRSSSNGMVATLQRTRPWRVALW